MIWPFFFTAGVMNYFILNLGLPDAIGRDLSWPALGWALALGVPAALGWLSHARGRGRRIS